MEEVTCPLCSEKVPKQAMRYHTTLDDLLLQVVLKDHPDWKEYDQAMVQQDAVVVLVKPERVYGRIR